MRHEHKKDNLGKCMVCGWANEYWDFEHGEEGTHTACQTRIKKEGGKTQCCICVPHERCELIK